MKPSLEVHDNNWKSGKSWGCHFGVNVLDFAFGKVLQLDYIVYFDTYFMYFEITFLNNIAEDLYVVVIDNILSKNQIFSH